jgi:competence protein ComEC
MPYFIHSAPFIRIAAPFILGVGAALYLEPSKPIGGIALFMSATVMLVLLVFWKKWQSYQINPVFGLLCTAVFFFLAFSWTTFRIEARQYATHFSGSEVAFMGYLKAEPVPKSRSTQLEIHVVSATDSAGFIDKRSSDIIAYAHLDLRADTLQYGDIVCFRAMPNPHQSALNPGQFDYGTYLLRNGILASVYLKDEVEFTREDRPPFSLSFYFQSWRERAIALFRMRNVADRELGVISALVLGKRDLVDPEIRRAFTDAGTVHILAVSGLHVGIIYLFIAMLLSRALPGKRTRVLRLIICLLVLWIYAGITGFSPSVLRAATMFSFIAVGKEFSRFGSIYNMLAASAFVLLMLNPFLLVQVGFQLSYLAVLGIVVVHPMIYPLFTARWWLLDKAWSLLVVSFSAQLATFPLTVHYFNQFPNYFLISNLLVIPLATFLLYGGVFSILFSWVPGFSDLLFAATAFLAKLLNDGVLLFSKLPSPVSQGLYLTFAEAWLLYALAVSLYLAYQDPRFGRLRMAQALLLLLIGMYGFRKIDGALSPETLVMHLDGRSLIVASQGRMAHLYQVEQAPIDAKGLEYSLSSYFMQRGVKDTLVFQGAKSLVFKGKSIVYVGSIAEWQRASTSQPDYIIFQGQFDPRNIIDLPTSTAGTVYIMDGAMPFYRRNELEHLLDNNRLCYWNTARQGAIRL